MVGNIRNKLSYLVWAAAHWPGAETSCPACKSGRTTSIKRKYTVTALYECGDCGLRFRVPKSSPGRLEAFYQAAYKEGATTHLPDDEELEAMKSNGFVNMESCYSGIVDILHTVDTGPVVYEFGSSWGYGSWVLRQAGFEVYSYEISRARSSYASEKLGCHMLSDPVEVPRRVDCFLSVHVIEHLADPCYLWKIAKDVLKPDGLVVLFMPNGDPARESSDGYHQLWGHAHPLFLTAPALQWQARQYGFEGMAFTNPYFSRELTGIELLFVAWPREMRGRAALVSEISGSVLHNTVDARVECAEPR
jgi:SAM-dependent methyltransferase